MLLSVGALLSTALTLPCEIHGFSVSSKGFVALLADTPRSRLLPLKVNAEDTTSAQTPEALTLLQLLQGIDLGGAVLPPELLQQRTRPDATVLQSVAVRALQPPCDSDLFDLCVPTGKFSNTSPFETLALAMRYDCPIEVEANLLDFLGLKEAEAMARYPNCFTKADAAEQRSRVTKRMAGLPSEDGVAAPDSMPAAIDSFDPSSLAPPPVPEPSPINANKPPPDMLKRALAVAKAKGDEAAVAKIEKMIKAQGEQWRRELGD
jgi:hypothetical protein